MPRRVWNRSQQRVPGPMSFPPKTPLRLGFAIPVALFVVLAATHTPASGQISKRRIPAPQSSHGMSAPTDTVTAPPSTSLLKVSREDVTSLPLLTPRGRVELLERTADRDDDEATRFLIEAWTRAEIQLEQEATWALSSGLASRTDDPSVVRTLIAILEMPERPTQLATDAGFANAARKVAALALARNGSTPARDRLFAALRMNISRGAALNALLAYPPKTLPSGLTGLLVQPLTLEALVELRDLRTSDLFLESTKSNNPEVRALGFQGARALRDERAIPQARKALSDSSEAVQRAAAELLVTMNTPERVAVVEAMLEKPALVNAAVQLARSIESPKIQAKLLALANDDKLDFEVRSSAIQSLASKQGSARLLLDIAKHPDVRAFALQALVRSQATDVPLSLRGVVQSTDAGMRSAGYRAYTLWALRNKSRDAVIVEQARIAAKKVSAAERDACVFLLAATESETSYVRDTDVWARRMTLLGAKPSALDLSEAAKRETDSIAQGVLVFKGAPYTRLFRTHQAEGRGLGATAAISTLLAAEGGREITDRFLELDGPLIRSAIYFAWPHAQGPSVHATSFVPKLRKEMEPRVRRALIHGLRERLRLHPEEAELELVSRTLTWLSNFDPDAKVRSDARTVGTATLGQTDSEPLWVSLGGATSPDPKTAIFWTATDDFLPVVFDRNGDAIVVNAGEQHGDVWMLPGH
jgi:HEAT repeats